MHVGFWVGVGFNLMLSVVVGWRWWVLICVVDLKIFYVVYVGRV